MSLKIDSSTLVARQVLSVDSAGVHFSTGSFGAGKRYRFRDIECVLMSPDNKLSFQVGTEVFTIPVKPDQPNHQRVIDTLVSELVRNAE